MTDNIRGPLWLSGKNEHLKDVMSFHDPVVMGSNPCRIELGVHSPCV